MNTKSRRRKKRKTPIRWNKSTLNLFILLFWMRSMDLRLCARVCVSVCVYGNGSIGCHDISSSCQPDSRGAPHKNGREWNRDMISMMMRIQSYVTLRHTISKWISDGIGIIAIYAGTHTHNETEPNRKRTRRMTWEKGIRFSDFEWIYSVCVFRVLFWRVNLWRLFVCLLNVFHIRIEYAAESFYSL